MRRILVINPFTVDPELVRHYSAYLEGIAREDTSISLLSLKNGPKLEEYELLGSEYGLPEILDIVRNAQDDYDGIMISCFEDPGVAQARAISRIPIAGPCECAMFAASLLGQKFFVISPDECAESLFRDKAMAMGLAAKFDAFELVGLDVPEFAHNEQKLADEICTIIERVRAGSPSVVAILGCTAFGPLHPAILQQVEVPVIEPAAVAIAMLETVIDSRRPPARAIAGIQLRSEVRS